MVNVTEAAQATIKQYFEDKEISPIRIYLGAGSCCGPALAMALDDPQDDDETYEIGDFTFVVDKALSEAAGELTVDMTYMGLAIQSENDITGNAEGSCSTDGAGSCGSGCCGGCGS